MKDIPWEFPLVSKSDFITLMSSIKYSIGREYGRTTQDKLSKYLRSIYTTKLSTTKWHTHILGLAGLKVCIKCVEVYPFESFPLNPCKAGGLNTLCKPCHYNENKGTQAARQAKYKAAKLNQVPKWADLQAISTFYANCPEGMQVDHIVPLQGVSVSGLHTIDNLQYLSIFDNMSKHNKLL